MNSKLYKLRLMAAAALTLMMTMMVLTACTSDNDHNPTPQPTDGKALVGTWVSDLTGKTHTMWTYGKAWNVWTFNADGTGVCDVYFTCNDQPLALQHQPFTYTAEGGNMTVTMAVNAAATMDGNIYDLSGRRVMQPTRSAEGRLFPKGLKKGLYIVRSAEGRLQGKNGKKVVVK